MQEFFEAEITFMSEITFIELTRSTCWKNIWCAFSQRNYVNDWWIDVIAIVTFQIILPPSGEYIICLVIAIVLGRLRRIAVARKHQLV